MSGLTPLRSMDSIRLERVLGLCVICGGEVMVCGLTPDVRCDPDACHGARAPKAGVLGLWIVRDRVDCKGASAPQGRSRIQSRRQAARPIPEVV